MSGNSRYVTRKELMERKDGYGLVRSDADRLLAELRRRSAVHQMPGGRTVYADRAKVEELLDEIFEGAR